VSRVIGDGAGWLFRLSYPYRLVSDVQVDSIFHISGALWEVGETVVLEVSRCRHLQLLGEGKRRRRARLVYFFPARPTRKEARAQSMAGRRNIPRYLYELEPLASIPAVYRNSAAMGTPNDLAVKVLARQPIGTSGFLNRKFAASPGRQHR
jgi:hypothetical protein